MEKVYNIKYPKSTGALKILAQMILSKKISIDDKIKAWERFDKISGIKDKTPLEKFIDAGPKLFTREDLPSIPDFKDETTKLF